MFRCCLTVKLLKIVPVGLDLTIGSLLLIEKGLSHIFLVLG